MPPPRPFLLSRPCHPRWVTSQSRWVSGQRVVPLTVDPVEPRPLIRKVPFGDTTTPVPSVQRLKSKEGYWTISQSASDTTNKRAKKRTEKLQQGAPTTYSDVKVRPSKENKEKRREGMGKQNKRLTDPAASDKQLAKETDGELVVRTAEKLNRKTIARYVDDTETQEILGKSSSEETPSKGRNRSIEDNVSHSQKEPTTEPALVATTRLTGTQTVNKTASAQGEQSLLEELFPELKPKDTKDTREKLGQKARDDRAKLELPRPILFPKVSSKERRKARNVEFLLRQRENFVKALQNSEDVTVLRLSNCSLGLSEWDFRRLVPRGRHIENWPIGGEFYKVIPARNPISLERLPEYYLLFQTPAAALEYQKNASRLHKLSGLHSPNSIFSPIQPPEGFLGEHEDWTAAVRKYTLAPPNLKLTLNMMLQPYHPWFRRLMERGGYRGVISRDGEEIPKVLLHIEGWEPTHQELYDCLYRDGDARGFHWPIRHEAAGITKLRDVIRYNPPATSDGIMDNMDALNEDFDLYINEYDGFSQTEQKLPPHIMTKMYNRWIVEFDDADMARRFANTYHCRILPKPHKITWKVHEVERYCNCEVLW